MSASYIVQSLTEFAPEMERAFVFVDAEDEATPETLAIILCAVRDCRADLDRFYKAVERDLMLAAGEKRFVVEHLGEVEIKKQTKRTQWDNHALWRVVVARALDERTLDEETGEYEPAHESVSRVLEDCARPSWRLTALRARGIDESEFCSVEPAGYAVALPPRST